MNPFLAEIRIFACSFAPKGWALCNGQLLAISSNTALFSLIGTYYGGNGQTTFALPNFQGRAPMNSGQGAGLSPRSLGEEGGVESVTLLSTEMPAHTHGANAKPGGNNADPGGMIWADPGGRPAPNFFANALTTPQSFNPQAIGLNGGSQPHNNLMPYLTLNFCIALQGVFPARN